MKYKIKNDQKIFEKKTNHDDAFQRQQMKQRRC